MVIDLNTKSPNTDGNAITPSARIIRHYYELLLGISGVAILWVIAVAVVAAVLLSGFYRVNLDETATKRRFGDLVDASQQPGLHWRFPFIEHVDKFPTAKVHYIEVDTRINSSMSAFAGDFNLLDARFVIQYRVVDLARYLFRNNDPVEIMRSATRSAFVDVISSKFIYKVLITEKKYVEEAVETNIQNALDLMDPGLEIVSVNMVFVSPPTDVVPAFRAVNDAKAEKRQVVEAALRRKQQTLAQAEGVAAHIVDKATAEAAARIAEAKSAARRFLVLLQRDGKNSDQTRHTYYWNSVRKFLGKARVVVLRPGESPNIAVNLLDGTSRMPALEDEKRLTAINFLASCQGRNHSILDLPLHMWLKNLMIVHQVTVDIKRELKHTILALYQMIHADCPNTSWIPA